MENQYLVTWQWDDEGAEGALKVMSFDTYEEADEFLDKQKAGTILDRNNGEPVLWISPQFTGTLAPSLLK
jgi:hypothetical protein